MYNHYDVVVVGAGCIGAATALELSKCSQLKVLVIDEAEVATKATGKSGGMVRVYHQSPELMELARLSISSFWKEEFQETGSFYFVPEAQLEEARKNVQELKTLGYAIELLNPTEAQELFPQYDFSFSYIVYEPRAGFVDPQSCAKKWIDQALRLGVKLQLQTKLIGVNYENDLLNLSTSKGSIKTKVVSLATGAGTLELLEKHQIDLPLKVKELTVQASKISAGQVPMPFYFDYSDLSFAGMRNTTDGIELLSSHAGVPARLTHLKDMTAKSAYSEFDAYAPGRQGHLTFVSSLPGLFVSTGWGGTAFKLSPAIGKHACEMIKNYFGQRMNHVGLN